MPDRPTVLLVRHGHTTFNDGPPGGEERIRGWVDIPLDSRGRREGQKIAQDVAAFKPTHVISSDLQRAAETAQAVSRATKDRPRVIVTKKLRPWHLGDYEGQPVEKVADKMNTLVLKKFTPPPGDSETFDAFAQRFLGFLMSILDQVKKDPSRLPVLVTHTRNARLAEAWINGGERGFNPKALVGKNSTLGTGEGLVLTWSGREWNMKAFGDSAPPRTSAS